MTNHPLHEALEQAGVRVLSRAGVLECAVDEGLHARVARFEPVDLESHLGALEDAELDAPSWARGVLHALSEPRNSRGADMEFADAARTIMPLADRAAFARGFAAVMAAQPFVAPLLADLSLYFVVELSRGIRVLTAEQVARWGAHADRVERAAVSMLFHRTRHAALRPHDQLDGIDVFAVGDDCDGARVLILDAVDFSRCRAGCAVAFEAPGRLLVSRERDAASVAALAQRVAHGPVLSRSLAYFADGHLVR